MGWKKVLKSLEIFNFQSHAHTLVEFADGINIISGSSDSGKSALMRSIRWVTRNQPNGLGVVSWWAFRRNKQTEDTRVILTLTDGRTIERIRGTINGYILDGDTEHPLEAVGTGVPDKVRDALGLTDVNIQRQLDSPFLLADSAGDVARFFNKLIDMDEADLYQSAIETRRRRIASDINSVTAQLEAVERESKEFGWLDKAATILTKYERLATENDTLLRKITGIEESLQEYDAQKRILTEVGDPTRADALCEKIQRILRDSTATEKAVGHLEASIKEFRVQQEALSVDTTRMESLSKKITRLLGEQADIRTKTQELERQIGSLSVAERDANTADRELFPLEQELALIDICPLCGKRRTEAPEF